MGLIPEYVGGIIAAIPIVSIVMIAIAGGVWFFYVRKVGGYVGLFWALALTTMCLFVICNLHYITVNSIEEIRFWGILSLSCLVSTAFFLFLGGEYATSDQPISWRVMLGGGIAGILIGALVLSLAPEYASAFIYTIDLGDSGWSWQASPIFLIFLVVFLTGTLGFFVQFCEITYRAEINSPFKIASRKFIIALAIGFPTIIGLSIIRLFYANFDLTVSIILLISTLVILSIIFSIPLKEPRVIYLQPHKPIALFLVDSAGSVHFAHQFGSNSLMTSVELFAPAITAINSIVQQSLKLDQLEGIQEFSTDEHTFLLHMNTKLEMIGVLLVTKPTQMVRKALARFMSRLGSIWKTNYEHEILPSDQEDVNSLIADTFPFVAASRKLRWGNFP